MHGVQPIAKIAPSPKLASQPPRLLTSRPPSRSPKPGPPAGANDIEPVVAATDADAPASSGRHVRSSARDPEDAGEVQPEQDEDHAADLAQDRHPLRQAGGGERRRHAEEREHRRRSPPTYASAWRKAVQRDGPARDRVARVPGRPRGSRRRPRRPSAGRCRRARAAGRTGSGS